LPSKSQQALWLRGPKLGPIAPCRQALLRPFRNLAAPRLSDRCARPQRQLGAHFASPWRQARVEARFQSTVGCRPGERRQLGRPFASPSAGVGIQHHLPPAKPPWAVPPGSGSGGSGIGPQHRPPALHAAGARPAIRQGRSTRGRAAHQTSGTPAGESGACGTELGVRAVPPQASRQPPRPPLVCSWPCLGCAGSASGGGACAPLCPVPAAVCR